MSRDQAKAIIEKLVERFREHWNDYHLPDYNEAKTRQDFINPFFKALGWDIDNKKNELIYELYELTPDEIAIIENKNG